MPSDETDDDWVIPCDDDSWLMKNIGVGAVFGIACFYATYWTVLVIKEIRFRYSKWQSFKKIGISVEGKVVEKKTSLIQQEDIEDTERYYLCVEWNLPVSTENDSRCIYNHSKDRAAFQLQQESIREQQQQNDNLNEFRQTRKKWFRILCKEYDEAHIGQSMDLVCLPVRPYSAKLKTKFTSNGFWGLIVVSAAMVIPGMPWAFFFFFVPTYLHKRIQEGDECRDSVIVSMITMLAVAVLLGVLCYLARKGEYQKVQQQIHPAAQHDENNSGMTDDDSTTDMSTSDKENGGGLDMLALDRSSPSVA
eukprot:CAMPEP_0198154596 /NCGR_PEP_ID=MMETSP1443-20131203/68681_1 /TAXON_ID=186043 /ORGANISM="Entomoneis sp., Strain CCMP2396" /LENGTH=305 /DNA_ID=CAMNT_0043821277 /DNA_START=542 /DNA_END=1459 /DNA_ORIENTATION=+